MIAQPLSTRPGWTALHEESLLSKQRMICHYLPRPGKSFEAKSCDDWPVPEIGRTMACAGYETGDRLC